MNTTSDPNSSATSFEIVIKRRSHRSQRWASS